MYAVLNTKLCQQKHNEVNCSIHCNMWDTLIYKIIFTSCPIVRWSTCRSITRAGPLDVPVLVQDVFSCLHLIALSGQRVIWKKHQRDTFKSHLECVLQNCESKLGLTLWDSLLDDVIFLLLVPFTKCSYWSWRGKTRDWWTEIIFPVIWRTGWTVLICWQPLCFFSWPFFNGVFIDLTSG